MNAAVMKIDSVGINASIMVFAAWTVEYNGDVLNDRVSISVNVYVFWVISGILPFKISMSST